MKFRFILRLFFIVCFCLGLGQPNMEVQAANCIWTGDVSSDWNTIENWSNCNNPVTLDPKVPGSVDDVIIPDVANDPIVSINMNAVNSITINTGGVLTVNDLFSVNTNNLTVDSGGLLVMHGTNYVNNNGSNMLSIVNNGTITSDNIGSSSGTNSLNFESLSFTNSGTIQLNGNSNSSITINSPFNNSGTVQINHGGIMITKGGTHTGRFYGNPGTVFTISNDGATQIINFENTAEITIPKIEIRNVTVNFDGDFYRLDPDPDTIETYINLSVNSSNSGLIFNVGENASFLYLDKISIYGTSVHSAELSFANSTSGHIFPELLLGYYAKLINDGSLEIINKFDWKGSTLTGAGTTTIANTATFTISGLPHYLDGHDLVNKTTANWNAGTIDLKNDASFTNDTSSIFNANATTTMSTGTGTSNTFINNGLFTKKTDGTTTTINTDFTNNGEVEVIAGELVFGGNLTSGSNTTYDLGNGTLVPGETLTLEAAALLVGSGTLSSNLVNGGTVSPGSSPGIITVDGDYTQESGGVLEIELGGDVAGMGYDQLQVTDAATLAGTLDVSLYDGFVPSNGDQFLILDTESISGTFTTINLPTLTDGLEWQTEYTATGFTISVISSGTINGTVIYTGSTYTDPDIIIGLHSAVGEEPVKDTIISSGDSYSFEGLADGRYYVSAFIDADSSGGAPDPDEPFSWYVDLNGDPEAVVITGGNTVNDVDIVLEDSPVETGVINGTVTYTGNITTTGDIIVSLHESASVDDTPIETTIADGTGAYSFENLSDGTYYVAAFLDVNDSGDGPPDDGEPFSWYVDEFGDPKAVVVSDGITVSDVDITLEDSSYKIFLPLILK